MVAVLIMRTAIIVAVLTKTKKHDIFVRTVIMIAFLIVRNVIVIAVLIKTQKHDIFVRIVIMITVMTFL